MNSKPASGGLYIKNRDRPLRQSTRTPRDESHKLSARASEGTKSDSDYSPEVTVQNFGEGTISPTSEAQWPTHNDFEQTHEKRVIKSAANTFPSRAEKYMVDNPGDSMKGLMRNKYITVPDSKPAYGDQTDAANLASSSTVRVYDHATQSVQDYSSQNIFVQPNTRKAETYRGYPLNYVSSGTQRRYKIRDRVSHVATIRGHATNIGRKPKMLTIKPFPKAGTVRTIKGYNLGGNSSPRLPLNQFKYDVPDGSLAFRRSTAYADRKEYSFSKFSIELDKPELNTYAPGEKLSGRVIIEVNSKVEIRFIEILIVGLCSVHFAKNDPNAAKNAQEVVISKRSYIMGTPNGRYNSMIMAGKYVSKFKFVLPNGIPSTLKYESREHGFSFQIGYLVKARICDELGASSTRSTHSVNDFVKVLVSRRHQFYVQRPFNINSIPNAMKSASKAEFVELTCNCIPFLAKPEIITLSLDRSVILAGDEIHVRLQTSNSTAKKIKQLTCELKLRIASTIKPTVTYTVLQVDVHEPNGSQHCRNSRDVTLYEFVLPTQGQFIPTFLKGTKLLAVSYAVLVSVTFKSCISSIVLDVPVGIGPSVSPVYFEPTNTVPIFIRPKRFPNFSDDKQGHFQNGMVPTRTLENGRAVNA